MRRLGFLGFAAAFALASCGASPDDPANVPLLGKWLDESKLMTVKIGGTAIDPSEIPGIEGLQAKVKKEQEFCGEPRFLTKEAFQERMEENNPAKCTVERVETKGSRVLASGQCEAKELAGGFEGSASFKGESNMASDKVVYDMAINTAVRDPGTGEGELVTVEMRRTMTRLGDC